MISFLVSLLLMLQVPESNILIQNVNIIDVKNGKIHPAQDVLIIDGTIHQIGEKTDEGREVKIIEAEGKYLIPGLWDMHVHLSKTGPSSLPVFVANGVLGVRDMGSDYSEIELWKKQIKNDQIIGPVIKSAGPYIESQSSVSRMQNSNNVEPVHRTRVGVANPMDARILVDSLSNAGVDFLKTRSWPDKETYFALADAAITHNLPLTGHTFFLEIEDLFKSGHSSIEHFIFPVLSDKTSEERMELFRKLKHQGTVITPTLSTWYQSVLVSHEEAEKAVYDYVGKIIPERKFISTRLLRDWEEQLEEKNGPQPVDWERLFPDVLRNFREMHEAGMTIFPGTDVAVLNIYPGFGLHDELEWMVSQIGMSPAEVLRAATLEPAEWLGLSDRLGTVEEGKMAELVLLKANPLADISNTKDIQGVLTGNKYYGRDQLDQILADVSDNLARERDFSGNYNLKAMVGPNEVPVDLELELKEFTYYGKMKVNLPSPVHVSLRSHKVEGDSLLFKSSSPVRSVKLWHADEDSLGGRLILNNGLEVGLQGVKVSEIEKSFAKEYEKFTLFEDGNISLRNRGEAFITFNPEHDELLVSVYNNDFGRQTIYHSVKSDEEWSVPKIARFSGMYSDRSPMYSPDGTSIYFASTRPHQSGEQEREDFDLWRIQKKEDGTWEEPELLSVLNSAADDYQPSVTKKGIYFVSNREPGIGGQDVYYAAFNSEGNLEEPVLLGKEINSEFSEISVFVNSDEEFMILSTSKPMEGAIGNDDLYLLQNKNGNWSNPVNLSSKINSFVNEYGAFVSNDGQILYYGSDINPPASIYKMNLKELFKGLGVEWELH